MSASTLLDRIWDAHRVAGATPVVDGAEAGELPDLLYVDMHLIHESTSAQAFAALGREGAPPAPRRAELALATADHTVATGIPLIAGASVPAASAGT
ncbi:MAG: hypothetical protein KJ018_04340, partial [Burkholderiales bacterium]|nr:hypothetical protein [Burkholderiales bacterium]